MAGHDQNRISTVSGKSFDEVRNQLLRRTIRLKERIGLRYDQLYKDSLLDNVRKLLADLRTKEEEDTKLIKKALETGVIKIGNDNKPTLDYEMLDHIIAEDLADPNPNDLQSVLLSAMKISNDLHKILLIMSEEYKVTGIGGVLKTLAEHEMNNKNRLAEIYDDMINKDYW
ncbi:MAG: hypothetical protein M0T81_01540 [Thermoplasmatales archaeon]|nr:hypothetical protein [Thermoplasmatales archaeon]